MLPQRCDHATGQVRLPPLLVGEGVEDAVLAMPEPQGEPGCRRRFGVDRRAGVNEELLELPLLAGCRLDAG